MTPGWADVVPPASCEVACHGEIHQLLWEAGELLTPAHADPEAERALAGLGGAPCRCVELLDPLTAVLAMGDQLPRRLVATVAHSLAGHIDHGLLRPMLHVGVATRVLNAVRRWQPAVRPEVVLQLIPASAERSLSGVAGEKLVARLPLEWLTEVWAPGLDVISGEFTLTAQRDPSGTTELVTVDRAMACHTRTP